MNYAPGDVFTYDTIQSTLLELSDEMFRTEVEADHRASGGPLHRHLHSEERFIVHEGVLRVRSGLRGSRLVHPGEEIAIPAGRPHTFGVVTETARFTAEFTPPKRMAFYFPGAVRPGPAHPARPGATGTPVSGGAHLHADRAAGDPAGAAAALCLRRQLGTVLAWARASRAREPSSSRTSRGTRR